MYKRKVNWYNIGSYIVAIGFMALLKLHSPHDAVSVIISLSFIGLFSLGLLFQMIDWMFYRLILSDDCIIEKKLFKKDVKYMLSDVNSIQISLDNSLIFLKGKYFSKTFQGIGHSDKLIISLCKRIGYDATLIRP